MEIDPANDFNALSWLSPDQLTPAMREKLLAMALNGDSIVNPFGAGSDDDRSPRGRARREREEQEERAYETAVAQLEERQAEFQRDLDRREQACIEALHENEEQLREARKELERIRERAYEITLPDGSTTKVYRDGNKVRMEDGTEVSRDIVKAEDLGSQHSTWTERMGAAERVEKLELDRRAVESYHHKIVETRGKAPDSDTVAHELERSLDSTRPQSVTAKEFEPLESAQTQGISATARDIQKLSDHFAAADRDKRPAHAEPVLSGSDFDTIRKSPTVSSPASR